MHRALVRWIEKKRYASRDILPISRGARYACSLIASIRLAETLAKEAAFQERRRISRDLHDSAMQPYIALKLGLEAMQRRLRGTPLAGELDELIKIANDGIGELRQYVVNLKNAAARKQLTSLLTAARAKKFTEFYNIDAQVIAPTDISVSAPLRNDVIQIVREGLSNIRRHTAAERATINLREQRGCLLVEVINDNARREAKREFYPRSIGERATELGGRVSVRRGTGGRTVVAVELPPPGRIMSSTAAISVLLVDDHHSVLWGLGRLIETAGPQMRVADSVTCARDALAAVKNMHRTSCCSIWISVRKAGSISFRRSAPIRRF